jgi:hypothetical protein
MLHPHLMYYLRAADFSLKSKLLRSELSYKVTAGPNGTRLLHLNANTWK